MPAAALHAHARNGEASERRAELAARPALLQAFAEVVLGYLLHVLPSARRELSLWRTAAARIPDPVLRRTAEESLLKRGNIEGAALFATLAPRAHRRGAVRALVAFQTAYNYLDALSEHPSEDPLANAARLHQALLCAVQPGAAHCDYYAHNPDREDGGYLLLLLDACRRALAGLPSFSAVAPAARAAAARIVDFQTLNLPAQDGGHDALRRWALEASPDGSQLQWWEAAAAGGSSLAVHALIAAAASPGLERSEARRLHALYFPWAGALHSLLDSLVDRDEDRSAGYACLLDHYRSPDDAAARLQALAGGALDAAAGLGRPERHRVILIAMCSYYLSAPECDTDESRAIGEALRRTLGVALSVALLLFRARRLASRLVGEPYN
ncbi:MAG TPA: DUF2600 family protein [Solirubrobacteraceae bacterium]